MQGKIVLAAVIGALLLLTACGGGSGSTPAVTAKGSTPVSVTITDAPGASTARLSGLSR